eukprot:m.258387 g.258387  ORF g.258387 m.258387 type:complete len:199 (-) comp36497_c0_seq1:220-816(-)
MDSSTSDSGGSPPGFATKLVNTVKAQTQKFLDNSVPYKTVRWVVLLATLAGYLLRTYLLQGWYIITYALGIYLLNLLIAFLSPRIDPALAEMEDDADDDGQALPTRNSEEFKPFIRRLPEFKFWLSAQRSTMFAIFCTFFEAFNVPVFWPILVVYFCLLFWISMKRQIKHMIKYKYLPFTTGKPKHKGREDTGKVVAT